MDAQDYISLSYQTKWSVCAIFPLGASDSRCLTDFMAVTLTNTGRVLLGMIAEGHATGYAIKAAIDRSTSLYWGASIGGIYPELRRLEQAGLVSSRDDFRGGTRRHAYRLTQAGRGALHGWLASAEEPVLEMRHEALLRLRFAGVLPVEEQLDVLRRMRAAHELRLAALERRQADEVFDDPLHRLTFEFGAGWNAWARDWCLAAEQSLSRRRTR
jgi:DNA-binding PadR family transcriptional regulator